jgi:hypothetical protein
MQHQPGTFAPPASPYGRGPVRPTTQPTNIKRNFAIAGICVLVGAILLVTTFAVLRGARDDGSNQTNTGPQSTTSAPTTQATTPATAGKTPTVAVSPTATANASQYPGSQYLDGAQLSTGVDKGQPTDNTTTFKPGQRIYITFASHSTTAGAYCLVWYINSKPATDFSFKLKEGNLRAYSYVTLQGKGPAYVELSWASSEACTDKQLAQRLDFTLDG